LINGFESFDLGCARSVGNHQSSQRILDPQRSL
jgi:hypothetical protein